MYITIQNAQIHINIAQPTSNQHPSYFGGLYINTLIKPAEAIDILNQFY